MTAQTFYITFAIAHFVLFRILYDDEYKRLKFGVIQSCVSCVFHVFEKKKQVETVF